LPLLAELGAEYWNPMFPLLTPERAGTIHRAGYRISTWTVDDTDEMNRLLDMGVEAVVSNRIGELRHVLDRRRGERVAKV
jgi:glycerophosphoryl diester phosphodiesterase